MHNGRGGWLGGGLLHISAVYVVCTLSYVYHSNYTLDVKVTVSRLYGCYTRLTAWSACILTPATHNCQLKWHVWRAAIASGTCPINTPAMGEYPSLPHSGWQLFIIVLTTAGLFAR